MFISLLQLWYSYSTTAISCMKSQLNQHDNTNKPLFDYSQYIPCLPASKPDIHQSPCLPCECTAQESLCAAPAWNKHTDTWQNKDSESGLKQQHLPGVAVKGVPVEVELLEMIPRLLKIGRVGSPERMLMKLVEQDCWTGLLVFLWISRRQTEINRGSRKFHWMAYQ